MTLAPPPIDPDVLRALRDSVGGWDTVVEIALILLRETPRRLQAAEQALERGDRHAAAKLMHAVKGSVGYVGACALRAACVGAEDASGDAAAMARSFGEAQACWSELAEALDAIVVAHVPATTRDRS